MDTKIVPVDSNGNEIAAVTPPVYADPVAAMIQMAINNGHTPEGIEKLADLYAKMQALQSARLFAEAVAAFKAECPDIPRNREASFSTTGGARVSYKYADRDTILATITPYLCKHGLSSGWDIVADGGVLFVVCKLKHTSGHFETSRFPLKSGGTSILSASQKEAVGETYAQRRTLMAILSLQCGDPDTDGATVEERPTEPCITEDQAANIDALIDDAKANRDGFLRWVGVSRIEDIPASRFKAVIEALEKKRGGK